MRIKPGPIDAVRMREFVDSFLYDEDAILVDEVLSVDPQRRRIEARLETTRALPYSARQRVRPGHPAHVSGPDLIMVTGSLGCMHAWFFHGCRWDEGWVGFGNRIHRADFKRLASIGPDLRLESAETNARVGARRVVIRYRFEFRQKDELVYLGDQSAMFVKNGFTTGGQAGF